MNKFWLMLDEGAAGGGAGGSGGAAGGAGDGKTDLKPGDSKPPAEINFDEFIKTQPEEVRKAFEKNTQGLKSALGSEREQRGALEKQVKELAAKADKGSELEKSLNELTAKLESSDRHSTFVEEAVKPEIGCTNIKAAYALAVSEELFDKRGNVNWDALRKEAPELFGKPGDGGAGHGTGGNPPGGKETVDDIIRRQAGIH